MIHNASKVEGSVSITRCSIRSITNQWKLQIIKLMIKFPLFSFTHVPFRMRSHCNTKRTTQSEMSKTLSARRNKTEKSNKYSMLDYHVTQPLRLYQSRLNYSHASLLSKLLSAIPNAWTAHRG